MIDIFEEFATDPVLEKRGAWFPIGKGTRLMIARGNNREFNKQIMKEVEAEKVILDREDDEAHDLSDKIRARVMARTILLGWETTENGVTSASIGFKGEVLPYTDTNAEKLLNVSDFRELVGNLSNKIDGYKYKQEKNQGNA